MLHVYVMYCPGHVMCGFYKSQNCSDCRIATNNRLQKCPKMKIYSLYIKDDFLGREKGYTCNKRQIKESFECDSHFYFSLLIVDCVININIYI